MKRGRPKGSKKRKQFNFTSSSQGTAQKHKKKHQWNNTPSASKPGASIHDSQGIRDQRGRTARTKKKRPDELLSSPSENTVAGVSPSQRVSSSQHTAAQTLADLVSSPSADLVSSPSQNLQVQDANLSQNSVAEIVSSPSADLVSSPSQNLQAQDANLSQNSAAQILFGLRRNADTGDVPEVTNDNINEIRLKLGLESNVNRHNS